MIATKGDELLSRLISEAVVKSDLIKVEKAEKTQSYVEVGLLLLSTLQELKWWLGFLTPSSRM